MRALRRAGTAPIRLIPPGAVLGTDPEKTRARMDRRHIARHASGKQLAWEYIKRPDRTGVYRDPLGERVMGEGPGEAMT